MSSRELDDLECDVRDHVATLDSRWRVLLLALIERAVQLGHLTASTDVASVWELVGREATKAFLPWLRVGLT